MNRKDFVWATVTLCIAVLGYWGTSSGAKDAAKDCGAQFGIPAEKVVDYLHAVLQSDRTFYTVNVVERLQAKGVVTASENWQAENLLPLPVQFLHESNKLANSTDTDIGYRLISLWPINKRNGAKNEFENRGLQEVLKDPKRPYTEVVMNGPDAYLQAVYPDLAVSQACIGCHNAHPDSPKRDFKQNDVIGGMIVSVPLKHSLGPPKEGSAKPAPGK